MLDHFGLIIQKAIKLERKFYKFKKNRQNKIFREKELATFGLTIHGANFIDLMHINDSSATKIMS